MVMRIRSGVFLYGAILRFLKFILFSLFIYIYLDLFLPKPLFTLTLLLPFCQVLVGFVYFYPFLFEDLGKKFSTLLFIISLFDLIAEFFLFITSMVMNFASYFSDRRGIFIFAESVIILLDLALLILLAAAGKGKKRVEPVEQLHPVFRETIVEGE